MGVDARDPGVRALTSARIPCVAVDVDLVGRRAGYVMSDNVAGAREAVRHLHALGHERIAIIAGPPATRPGADRLLGYRAELEHLGLPYRDEYVEEGDFYPDSGYAAMGALLDLPEPPTAVFAASDLMAAGAARAAQERCVTVPGDVSLIGFDDIQLAALMQPSLTTIRQDKAGLGNAAADALTRMVDVDAAPAVVTLPVELVIRASTGPPRT
jgi:LacI family transcriptional regulator